MPIVYQKEISSSIKLAVWHIVESTSELEILIGPDHGEAFPDKILENKKNEVLATRILLKELCHSMGLTYEGIYKDEYGKPYLKKSDHHISISHAYPYAAAIIDADDSTGIDLEAPREQIHRIKHKFLSDQEMKVDDVDRLTILWAAKECLYKIYGRKQLIFRQDLAVDFLSEQQLVGHIAKGSYQEKFHLTIEKSIVIGWSLRREGVEPKACVHH